MKFCAQFVHMTIIVFIVIYTVKIECLCTTKFILCFALQMILSKNSRKLGHMNNTRIIE